MTEKQTTFKLIFKWLFRLLVFFLLLLLAIAVAIQFPAVQQKTVDYVTNKIKRDTDLPIEIGKIKLQFLKTLDLEDVRIDTFLEFEKAKLTYRLQGLNHLQLSDLKLKNGVVRLDNDINGQPKHQKLLELLGVVNNEPDSANYIGTTDPSKVKKPFLVLENTKVQIDSFEFYIRSEEKRNYHRIYIPHLKTELISQTDTLYTFNTFLAENPTIEIINYPFGQGPVIIDTTYVAGVNEVVEIVETIGNQYTGETKLYFKKFDILNAYLDVDNQRKDTPLATKNVVDFIDPKFSNIQLSFEDLLWQPFGIAKGKINKLAFSDVPTTFKITHLKSKSFTLSEQELVLNDMELVSPHSKIGPNLTLRYNEFPDFKSFENNVILNAQLSNSYMGITDILHLFRDANVNTFFTENPDKRLSANGRILGTVNNFSSRGDITLNLAEKAFLNGRISLNNITINNEQLLNLDLNNASVDIQTMRDLIPGFDLPSAYDELGTLNYEGRFDGFFQDFVAYGTLGSDLGRVALDMRLDVKNGKRDANYSGSLNAYNFNVGPLIGNPDIGRFSAQLAVKQGVGLELDVAKADIIGLLSKLEYRGYTYTDATLEGSLDQNKFDGSLQINDPNMNLDFVGSITFNDRPDLDFSANVDFIDTKALKWSKNPLQTSGNYSVHANLSNLLDINGTITGQGLKIKSDDKVMVIDSVLLQSDISNPLQKSMSLTSNVLEASVVGAYDLNSLLPIIQQVSQKHYPGLHDNLFPKGYKIDSSYYQNNFNFEATVLDVQPLFSFLDSSLIIENTFVEGVFRNAGSDIYDIRISGNSEHMARKKIDLRNTTFDIRLNELENQSVVKIPRTIIGNNTNLLNTDLLVIIDSNSLNFNLDQEQFTGEVTDIHLAGALTFPDGKYSVKLGKSYFDFLNDHWVLIPNNFIEVDKKNIRSRNLGFVTNNESYIRFLTDRKGESAELELEKIDISFLDDIVELNDITYDGLVYATIGLPDLANINNIKVDANIVDLALNNDRFGDLALDTRWNPKGRTDYKLTIIDTNLSLLSDGYFSTHQGLHDYSFNTTINDFPLSIGEYFIGDMISTTEGTINAEFSIKEEGRRPAFNGYADLDGQTKINYLGTNLYIDNQRVKLGPTKFDFTDCIVMDEQGNEAKITGAFTHEYLKRFKMDVGVSSNNFLALKTQKGDNDLFYGTALGDIDMQITGDFKLTRMLINGESNKGTFINIPLRTNANSNRGYFAEFDLDRDNRVDLSNRFNNEIKGLDITLNLSIDEDADMEIIFNEQTGDIIKANGRGFITIDLDRNGEMAMRGTYTISRGQYLYAFLPLINKPFLLEEGGTISWDGDPYQAQIDLNAIYSGKTSVYNLAFEELERSADEIFKQEARTPTLVLLTLNLTGEMTQPDIAFDMDFPNLPPRLKNLVDSKVAELKQNESELNRQVGSLLVLTSFSPPSLNVDLTSTSINTLSEYIANQVSIYLYNILEEELSEVPYLTDFDPKFSVVVYDNQNVIENETSNFGWEVGFNPRIEFYDRLSLKPGVSVAQGTLFDNSSNINGEIEVDYYITPDKRWNIKVYNRQFNTLQGESTKYGAGIAFRRSFDHFGEIFGRKKKKKKNSNQPSEVPPVNNSPELTESQD